MFPHCFIPSPHLHPAAASSLKCSCVPIDPTLGAALHRGETLFWLGKKSSCHSCKSKDFKRGRLSVPEDVDSSVVMIRSEGIYWIQQVDPNKHPNMTGI